MRRLPPSLGWLFAAVALTGIAWALAVPAWQSPDEDAHFAYAQTLAELHRRPHDDGRTAAEAEKSTEQHLAERDSGFIGSYQRIEAKPEWSAAAQERWERANAALSPRARRDGGGANAAQANPPTYYLYAALGYEAASGGTVLDQLYAMRLVSVPLLLVFALSAWLLAGELVGRVRPLQLLAGALAGLLPMATFIGSSVTPDALVLPLWGLATWLGVRVLRGGRGMVWLVLVTLGALAVKPVTVALLPGVAWVLLARLWRRPVPSVRVRWAAAAALVVAGLAAAVALAPGGPRRLATYLWQFYLPELPGQYHFARLPPWPLRDVWLEGVAGSFGWLEVRFPGWVYALVAVVGFALLVGAVRAWRPKPAVLVFLALPALALLAGLHLTEYRMLVNDDRAFTQGRYLLPLAPLAACVAAAAVGALAPKRRALATGALLGAMAAWQLASLAIVVGRFYA